METEYSLDKKINNYFKIELLDSMGDVQGDINKILREFIEELQKQSHIWYNENGVWMMTIHKEIFEKIAGEGLI